MQSDKVWLWLSFYASGTMPVDYTWSSQNGAIQWNATGIPWCAFGPQPNWGANAQYVIVIKYDGATACYTDANDSNVDLAQTGENALVWAACQYSEHVRLNHPWPIE